MLFDEVDPRLQPVLRGEWLRRRGELGEALPCDVTVVLAGHRAAGKSRMLQPMVKALGREAVDLDVSLGEQSQRSLREWVASDERGFRAAERELFSKLPPGLVVAVGGGFLSHHADLLRACVTVEVPISFETYVERLQNDGTRPRLRPELPVVEELKENYAERELLHAQARPLSLVDFMLRLTRGRRPRRVVTLPPHQSEGLEAYAWRARRAGADLLEVRSDQHPPEVDLLFASLAMPLLVSHRAVELAHSGAAVNVYANSNFGRAFRLFEERHLDAVGSRTTVIVIGDGRNNYQDPSAWALGRIRARARRVLWLNPEPRGYWDTGDSIISEYAKYCDGVFECRNLRQLERFVATIAEA